MKAWHHESVMSEGRPVTSKHRPQTTTHRSYVTTLGRNVACVACRKRNHPLGDWAKFQCSNYSGQKLSVRPFNLFAPLMSYAPWLTKRSSSNSKQYVLQVSVGESELWYRIWGGEGQDLWHKLDPGARNSPHLPCILGCHPQGTNITLYQKPQTTFNNSANKSSCSQSRRQESEVQLVEICILYHLVHLLILFAPRDMLSTQSRGARPYQRTCNSVSAQMTQVLSIAFQYSRAFDTKGFSVLACFNVSSYCVDRNSRYLLTYPVACLR